jgi:hypothetical protein
MRSRENFNGAARDRFAQASRKNAFSPARRRQREFPRHLWSQAARSGQFRVERIAAIIYPATIAASGRGHIVDEEEVFEFIRKHIGSVGTLELLIWMQRGRDRMWQTTDLVRELRSSPVAIAQGLSSLQAAELVAKTGDDSYSFAPASALQAQLAADIEKLYAVRPVALMKVIMTAPNEKLRIFSDAFKLKE